MTFQPPSASLSIEQVSDSETGGYQFSDATVAGLRDGFIRQIPQITGQSPSGVQWPVVPWGYRSELPPTPGVIQASWDPNFSSGFIEALNPLPLQFDLQQNYMKIDTSTGEYFYIEQNESGQAGTTQWPLADNSTGYTIQLKVRVKTTDTGSINEGHTLLIDDGTYKKELYFTETGVGFRDDTGVFLGVDLKSQPREVRIGVKQDDIHILFDNGIGYVGADQFTGTSSGVKKLSFGSRETGTHGVTFVDYIYQYHEGVLIDTGIPDVATYSTGEETTTTPEFYPRKNVQQYKAAYFGLTGASAGGTTEVKAQYTSSVTTSWTDYDLTETGGYYIELTGSSEQEILLDNIPTIGDGTDKLRFVVQQSSDDGSAEAIKISRISLQTQFSDAKMRGFPRWGQTEGGNTIALELHSTSGLYAQAIVDTGTAILYRFDETGGSNVVPAVSGHNSGTYDGSVLLPISSPLGTQVQLGTTVLDTGTNLNDLFTGYNSVVGTAAAGGQIATGFTIVKPSGVSASVWYEVLNTFKDSTDAQQTGVGILGQKTYCSLTGDGLQVDDYTVTGSGIHMLSMQLQINRGAVQVQLTGEAGYDTSHYFTPMDYQGVRTIRLITPSLTNSEINSLRVLNASGVPGSGFGEFTISNLQVSKLETGAVSIPINTGVVLPASTEDTGGWSIDTFVQPIAYNMADTGSMIFDVQGTGTDSVSVSMNNIGYPVLDAVINGQTIPSTTGNWPLILDERKNVAVTYYDRVGANTGYLALLVDGEVNALVRNTSAAGALDISNGTAYVGQSSGGSRTFHGYADQFRIRSIPTPPEYMGQHLGITDTFFRDLFEIPAETGVRNTKALLHVNESSGPIVDDGGFWGSTTTEVIVPHERRRYTNRGAAGVLGGAISFTKAHRGSGGMLLPDSLDFNNRSTGQTYGAFFYFGGYADTGQASTLVQYIADDDHGFKLDINTGGELRVAIYEGDLSSPSRELTHTGVVLGNNQWAAVGLSMDSASGTLDLFIDNTHTSETGDTYDNFMTGDSATGVEVGYGVMGMMDQFHLFEGPLDTGTFNTWRIPNKVKGLPNNSVYVGGTKLSQDRVLPVDSRKLYVVMPEGSAGETHVYADFQGVKVAMERPYKYVQSYDRDIDFSQIENAVCRTKSPFRIGDTVPDGSINLAVMNTPDLTVAGNMSQIDLSDLELSNISDHLRGQFSLTSPNTGVSDQVSYSNQIDTREIVISNRSVSRRGVSDPSPLFYKYLIGNGRYYVKVPGASASDTDMIRSAIQLVDDNGSLITQEEFPWDIEISASNIDGNPLPSNVFSVALFTSRLFLIGRTIFVKANTVDSINYFKVLSDRREIVNSVPIMNNDSTSNRDTFTLDFTSVGTYNVTINTG